VPVSNKEAACGQPSFPSLRLRDQGSIEHTYIVIFMKPSKRQARSRWVAAGIGWSRFRKLQPLLQLRTNEINSGSVRATVANEIYMKLRIGMASSHSGSFVRRRFLGRNTVKRMSARQGVLSTGQLFLNCWEFKNFWGGGGGKNLQLMGRKRVLSHNWAQNAFQYNTIDHKSLTWNKYCNSEIKLPICKRIYWSMKP
jgi:hypothetical protein